MSSKLKVMEEKNMKEWAGFEPKTAIYHLQLTKLLSLANFQGEWTERIVDCCQVEINWLWSLTYSQNH